MKRTLFASIAIGVAASMLSFSVLAEGLPKRVSWTAYGTTSSGYANGVAIGNVLKKNYGTEVRLIPGKNDVSRMIPVVKGSADLCACGAAAILLQEGVFDFAKPKWGPQRVLNIFNNAKGRNGTTLALAGDVGVKKMSDLKGKRMAFVRGAPALNANMAGALAFGGLTWKDVTRVDFPGWKQAVDGVIGGQADAVIVSTVSPHVQRLAASPRGMMHPAFDHNDDAAWNRARKEMPIWNKRMVSVGISLKDNMQGKVPYEGMGYPYPIYVTYGDRSVDFIYSLTKAVVSHDKEIIQALKNADGYGLDRQILKWVMPYHPGAIKYFREVGAWTAEHDAHNAGILKRQNVLAAAWKKAKAMNLEGDAHVKNWLKIRAAALDAAGMDVPFR